MNYGDNFVGEIGKNTVILGDCLDVLPHVEESSIDMILCDLPYGQLWTDSESMGLSYTTGQAMD